MEIKRVQDKAVVISIVVLICLIASGLLLYRARLSRFSDSVTAIESTVYNSAENQRLLDVEPHRKILLFSFDFSANRAQPFKLSALDEYNGHPEAVSTSPGDYSFSVIEDGNPVYTTNFSIQPTITEEFHDDGTIKRVDTGEQNSYALRTPRFNDGSTYIIRDSSGAILLEGTVRNVEVHDNQPDYKTFIAD